MSAPDRPTTRDDGPPVDRYGSVCDCTGRLLVYDLENPEAWVRGDRIVDLDEYR